MKRRLRRASLEIQRASWDFMTNSLAASTVVPPEIRRVLLRRLGLSLGDCRIKPRVFFGSREIEIGDGTFINYGVFMDGSAPISIGQNSSIAYEVMFATSSHDIGESSSRSGAHRPQPIAVGNGVWVGARATILGGVSIADGCLIAAGSLVTADCAADGLYAGAPARRVRDLPTGKA